MEIPRINLDSNKNLEQIRIDIKNEIFNYGELSKLSIEVSSPIDINQYLLKVVLKNHSVNFNNELLSFFSDIQNKFTSVKINFIFGENTHILFKNTNISLPENIIFDKCHIRVNICGEKSNPSTIDINDNNFKNCYFYIDVIGHIKLFSIIFVDVSIIEYLQIGDNKNKLDKSYIKSSFCHAESFCINLSNSIIEEIGIYNLKIINKELSSLLINKSSINKFNIFNTKFVMNFYLLNINNDFCSIFTKDSQFKFSIVSFEEKVFFQGVSFYCNLELMNVTINNNAKFENLDVELLDLTYTFFNNSSNIDFPELKVKNIDALKRSTCRKIKQFLEKEGNKIEANIWHSYELNAREKELNFLKNPLDSIVYFFNKITSNHGLNWAIPIFWMVVIGAIFSSIFYAHPYENYIIVSIKVVLFLAITIPIILLVGYFSNAYLKYGVPLVLAFLLYGVIVNYWPCFQWDYIFKFLNIINIDKDIPNYQSFFAKSIMAYLIYQFVMALRKDTRR